MTIAYLAAVGFEDELAHDLATSDVKVAHRHDRLFITEDPVVAAPWAANVWLDAEYVPGESIRALADALRARQRSWAAYSPRHGGRAALITERLPHVSAKPLALGTPAPAAPLGSWTLLSPNLMLASARCTSPFPNGEVHFVEDREGPPSRAYLKLWEAFVHLGRWPGPGDSAIDLGASPGGWTFTLARLGASVLAIDKAPLDAPVAALPLVEWRAGSAFALDPRDFDRVDWLCSDVIAYPARVLTMVERWLAAGTVSTMVITVKFQGPTDHGAVRAFAALPGATLVHLHHNKHELTFLHQAADRADVVGDAAQLAARNIDR